MFLFTLNYNKLVTDLLINTHFTRLYGTDKQKYGYCFKSDKEIKVKIIKNC